MKPFSNPIFLFFLLWSLQNHSFAQLDLQFDHLTMEKGLSDLSVISIFQDSQGFMWIGTDSGGLNRFDGNTFTVYKHEPGDPTSVKSNKIWTLLEDTKKRFWVGTGAGLNLYDRSRNIFIPVLLNEGDPSSAQVAIGALYQDSREDVWIGTTRGSLFRLESTRSDTSFTHYQPDGKNKNATGVNHVREVLEDSRGDIWVGTSFGLHRFDRKEKSFIHYPLFVEEGRTQGNNMVTHIEEDQNGRLWIGTLYSGLFSFPLDEDPFLTYRYHDLVPGSRFGITEIKEDSQGILWIATDSGGLFVKERKADEFINYRYDPNDPSGISDISISMVLEDQDGGIWIGSRTNGVSYWSRHKKAFTRFETGKGDKNSLSYQVVRSFFEGKDGKIWIATDGGGVNLFDPANRMFEHFRHEAGNPYSLANDKVISVLEDRSGLVWVAMWGGGVVKFDPRDPRATFRPYLPDTNDPNSLSSLDVRNIFEDSAGGIWIIAWGGLNFYDPISDGFVHYFPDQSDPSSLSSPYLFGMMEDNSRSIWIYHANGLDRLDPPGDTFQNYLPGKAVNSVCEDGKNNFWVGTSTGLLLLNREDGSYRTFGKKDGMPDNNVKGIVEDDQGKLWISTIKGLSKFDPDSLTFKNYDQADGLQSDIFSPGACLKSRIGALYFGGLNGFNVFYPENIRDNPKPPAVVITDFHLFNQTVPIQGTPRDTLEYDSPLMQNISLTREIRLQHWQNDISFEFTALNYLNPEKNRYQYRLVGYHDDWISTGAARRFAQYTNLSPGTYSFQVIASNNDGVWNREGADLRIVIMPPWWQTNWAYTLFILIGLMLLFGLRRYELNRALARAEAHRLKELDQVKTKLYTNITHEFRTPLTVISGMADQVLENPKDWFREGLAMIKRNSRHLLGLVNQMLDLAKLDSGKLSVDLIQDDIIKFLKYLTESFHSYAESKDIRLHLLPEVKELYMDFDPVKIQAIYTNLVGNAIKFTPVGGDVYISVSGNRYSELGDSLELKVKDNGIGIPEAQLPHIFDRFYQVDNSHTRQGEGTGIGLALTRELVNLLGGNIAVSSREGEGAEFTVWLPVKREAEKGMAEAELRALSPGSEQTKGLPVVEGTESDTELPLALLIEDHKDVLRYLAGCLQDQYRLETAVNGREGIEKAIEMVPDIIVSDVMMPEKDGFEVLDTLKKDERTSHIPIILLTAKADQGSRITGLQYGADAYLAKPFDKQELEVRLRKLIELRQKLQERYRSMPRTGSGNQQPLNQEDAFLQKVRSIIEGNIDDENFGIAQLCSALRISRVQLHRKLKALTGRSTSLVIRSIRLQKAKEMLESSDLNVSEVGYAVGFSNRSYFTQVFTEEFGQAPSFFKR